jgi:hypothetical protein
MCALFVGSQPTSKSRAWIARTAVAAVLAALGGCASQNSNTTAQYSAEAMRLAQAQTEIEDDGLPAQVPPPTRIRQTADDPSEPYSRNYGGGNPSASAAPTDEPAPQRAPQPVIPSDLPPAFREKLAAALSADE